MANTLLSMASDLHAGVRIVSRELVGIIPGVYINAAATRAAVGSNVPIDDINDLSAGDVTPSMTISEPQDTTSVATNLVINKSREVAFGFTGEDVKLVETGAGFETTRALQTAKAIRRLTNEVEADAAALYKYFSRATGTAGTAPFASTLSDSALVLQILKDNGAPHMAGWSLAMDTAAGAKLLTLTNLSSVNQAGDDSLLRQGSITARPVHGGTFRESGQIGLHTKGTGAGYVVDLVAGYDIGDTTIHVDTGTGTILAGDVVTFAGDTNKYLVTSGFAGDGDGDITIAAPGLRQTLADGVAMTIGNNYTPNMAYTQDAIHFAARLPALPKEGDAAAGSMIVTDPLTGIAYEFRMYLGQRKVKYTVSLAWGFKVVSPEHTAILLG